MENFSLREKKKALVKIAILEEMIQLLHSKELSEIPLEELCRNINISKVTFFNYFSHKEQVLDYFIHKWFYDRSYEIHCQQYHGVQGLLAVFHSISDEIYGKKLMLLLINYYTKLREKPAILEISSYEYYLFNKEAFHRNVKPLNLVEVFLHYVEEIESIDPRNYHEVIGYLIALMYGVPIETHVMGQTEMYPLYELGVKSIVKES
jgi:AcrR family transcriptional regulator